MCHSRRVFEISRQEQNDQLSLMTPIRTDAHFSGPGHLGTQSSRLSVHSVAWWLVRSHARSPNAISFRLTAVRSGISKVSSFRYSLPSLFTPAPLSGTIDVPSVQQQQPFPGRSAGSSNTTGRGNMMPCPVARRAPSLHTSSRYIHTSYEVIPFEMLGMSFFRVVFFL